jgi:hypothetical protein
VGRLRSALAHVKLREAIGLTEAWKHCVVSDDAMPDASWDEARRGESETQRLDRNWADLLQELRVGQTGVQLLTGFLLTLPFQQRFTHLDYASRIVYLVTVGFAVGATAALIAPVSIHRLLFRRHARRSLVSISHRCALAGLAMLGVAVCGAVYVITALVLRDLAGGIGAGIAAAVFLALWLALPLALRSRDESGR